jgi:WhiB family redox-sensing transcriptional regulator
MADIARVPLPIIEDWEWQHQGACRTLPSEMFFHPDGERGPRRRNRENAAKAICATCPVMERCRQHALANQEPYGIWGGLSEDDRASILTSHASKKLSDAS